MFLFVLSLRSVFVLRTLNFSILPLAFFSLCHYRRLYPFLLSFIPLSPLILLLRIPGIFLPYPFSSLPSFTLSSNTSTNLL
ncbi:hypothetical protein BDQ17DRAFT_1358666 [Cyathus striatus]|nr:hypothetical protein BDQ17DRAFT_1358666 [Cyathus striatus]